MCQVVQNAVISCRPVGPLTKACKWKHFPRHWPFVQGIHRSPVNSPHKGQWRGALVFSLVCASTNGSANNRDAGDLRRHRIHYDVTVMYATRRASCTLPAFFICCGLVITNFAVVFQGNFSSIWLIIQLHQKLWSSLSEQLTWIC